MIDPSNSFVYTTLAVECTNVVLALVVIWASVLQLRSTGSNARFYSYGALCTITPLLLEDMFAILYVLGYIPISFDRQDGIRNFLATLSAVIGACLSLMRFRAFSGDFARWYTQRRFNFAIAIVLVCGIVVLALTLAQIAVNQRYFGEMIDDLMTLAIVVGGCLDFSLTVATFHVLHRIKLIRSGKASLQLTPTTDHKAFQQHRHELVSSDRGSSALKTFVPEKSAMGSVIASGINYTDSDLDSEQPQRVADIQATPLTRSNKLLNKMHQSGAALSSAAQRTLPDPGARTWWQLAFLASMMVASFMVGPIVFFDIPDDLLRIGAGETPMHVYLMCVVAQWRLVLRLIRDGGGGNAAAPPPPPRSSVVV
ncbi:hypothetical protein BC828DRAFT_386732 [Blastocladiella britannica]|nr:hypothetical protein BC828DRAFT_386732 [Blastocladiella britannica]